ncbi:MULTISPECIES: phage holin [Exiguobacterium]|uniref:phage holin n=1 Tax=Exiguobacterium TaxID=33986 RepID=UPI001BE6B995|nr:MULTISPECIES: phage holin [Exiguobacterium]MCT4787665.1 SPP1 phage holin family protein [Exiguobacterium aestuarii]
MCSVHTGNKKTEQVFLSLGYNPMPFSEEQVTVGVNAVIGVAGTVYIWWENAPMTKETQEAQEAQVYLEELKKRKK